MATSPFGKSYIGQTSRTLIKRWQGHCNSAASSPYMAISKAIAKHGKNNFSLIVLCENIPDKYDANKLEVYFINYYNTYRDGYNNTPGGGNRSNLKYGNRLGQKNTEEHREKMSKATTKRFLDVEQRAKISEAKMGKCFTAEHRVNISKAQTGKRHSKKHREAVSKAIKEFWRKRKSGEYPETIKTDEGKRCTKCLVFKPYSEYYSPRGICKECTKIRARRQ